MHIYLEKEIESLKGIGKQKAKLLTKELGIKKIKDLLNHFPFRYDDKTQFCKIKDLENIEFNVSIKGVVLQTKLVGSSFKKRLVAEIKDETGKLELVWFKGLAWVGKLLKPGLEIIAYGKPTKFNDKINIAHPEVDYISKSTHQTKSNVIPVYKTTELLSKRFLNSRGIYRIQKELIDSIKENKNIEIPENLPSKVLEAENLMNRKDAFLQIHLPENLNEANEARRRLKFEELFYLQIRILKQKYLKNEEKLIGHKFPKKELLDEFINNHLPFELTRSQHKVIKEVYDDVLTGKHMNRLLQGDVGSGKTIVAFMSMLIAVSNGFQVTMMAPTEILAEQHFNTLKPFFEKLNIKSEILCGSTKQKLRREIFIGLETGYTKVLFGTHALLEENVKFKNLGLAIVDEQHRFGVAQRAKLWKKNTIPPHILVMTATPIPRTLAMTVYGDLDVSILKELPKGRKPIKTAWMKDSSRLKIFGFIREQIDKGTQAYIVYPLIEESTKLDYKYLEDGYESIKRAFPDVPIGVLHGRMRPDDKDYEMDLFVRGKTKIMIATTVIEVGINVPNATLMIIESAERFGLSQLHQLRGRVGRANLQSYCILVSGFKLTQESKERLSIMIKTTDGFEIANEDLKLRGPGNLLGTQQSGILELKIADLVKDEDILTKARNSAKQIIEEDPNFNKKENAVIKEYLNDLIEQGIDMTGIS
ncbi:MAG: ATP-dependent DNA helicase RecG [Bacteroidetes bacterium]|nr:ATP-dependent DNA helicase RecG [Bacteroidota bacterium]